MRSPSPRSFHLQESRADSRKENKRDRNREHRGSRSPQRHRQRRPSVERYEPRAKRRRTSIDQRANSPTSIASAVGSKNEGSAKEPQQETMSIDGGDQM
jgi:hypothetical protein